MPPTRTLVQMISDRSILTKLIISLFVIVTPLYAFNYMINQIAADKNRQEISRALSNSLDSYNNILEGEIARLQGMLHKSALDIALSHVEIIKPELTYTEKSDFFNRVRDNLNQIHYSSRFISETIAYLPLLDTTLTITGPGVEPFHRGQFAALSKPSRPFILWEDKLYLTVPFITKQNHEDGMFVLAVLMSRETIASYLSKIMNFEGGGTLFFDTKQSWDISTHESAPINQQIKEHMSNVSLKPAELRETFIESVSVDRKIYLIVYKYAPTLDTWLVAYAPESEIFGSLSIYHDFFYSMSVLSALSIILFSFWLYKLIHKPLRKLINGFRRVEIGNLDFTLVHSNKDEFGYLYHRFNDMLRNLDNLVNVVFEQKILNERSELKRLQAQINPHFLYNNFFVLKRLIRSGQQDKASTFADSLGRYFQFVTRNAADEISLEEEVQLARTYMDIQAVCFDQRIAVQFDAVPEAVARVPVPRMILQPLLENSYKHVFEQELAEGVLAVTFEHDSQEIRIVVEDNGKQMSDDQLATLTYKLELSHKQTEESTGLLNVHQRIRLKFGPASGISVSRSELGGLRTEITIHLEEEAYPLVESVDHR